MEGTLTHSLTCRSHTESRGHTNPHLPLKPPNLKAYWTSHLLHRSLSLTMEELSHSLTDQYSHSPTYIQQRAHLPTFHSHTQRGEHTHFTSSQRFEGTLTPTLFHTKIGWHTHSHIHPLKTSHSHILTNRPLSRIEWRPRSLLPPRS